MFVRPPGRFAVVPAILIIAHLVSIPAVYGASPSETLDKVVSNPVLEKPEPEQCTGGICYEIDEERKILKIYNRYILYHRLLSRTSKIVSTQKEALDSMKQAVTELQKANEHQHKLNDKLMKRYRSLAKSKTGDSDGSDYTVVIFAAGVVVSFVGGVYVGAQAANP